jgi:hypothetical protein
MEMEVHVLVHRLQLIGDRPVQEMYAIGTLHTFLSTFSRCGWKPDLRHNLSISASNPQEAYTCIQY